MKKTIYLAAAVMLLTLATLTSHAATTGAANIGPLAPLTKEAILAMTPEEKQARLVEIKARVEEIKALDKSTMTTAERKAYKAELKEMKKESKLIDPTIYIIGAVIVAIVIIVLIIV
jgi:hypothetical protein